MKIRIAGVTILAAALFLCLAGCRPPGKPGFRPETLRPDQTVGFAILYKDNCSACHGDKGMNGAAIPLHNPVYLAWAGHDRMVQIVSSGVPQRLMPAFAQSGGGFLTNQQVENIVDGMISSWGSQGALNGANAPAYAQPATGNAAAGKVAFQTYCARCHGPDGKGISPGGSKTSNAVVGSIVDPTYLSLISGQALRSIVVAGMPGEGMPDWRQDSPGKPMTDGDVTNVVAWLTSHRVQFPGQPFPNLPPVDKEYPAPGK